MCVDRGAEGRRIDERQLRVAITSDVIDKPHRSLHAGQMHLRHEHAWAAERATRAVIERAIEGRGPTTVLSCV
jgi:hypothetical protein